MNNNPMSTKHTTKELTRAETKYLWKMTLMGGLYGGVAGMTLTALGLLMLHYV